MIHHNWKGTMRDNSSAYIVSAAEEEAASAVQQQRRCRPSHVVIPTEYLLEVFCDTWLIHSCRPWLSCENHGDEIKPKFDGSVTQRQAPPGASEEWDETFEARRRISWSPLLYLRLITRHQAWRVQSWSPRLKAVSIFQYRISFANHKLN